MPESRIIASSVPQIMPKKVAIAVNVSVKVMPSRKRYGSERMMTSKSKLLNIAQPQSASFWNLRPKIAGNGHAALERPHSGGDDDVDDDVDDGRGGERLEYLK